MAGRGWSACERSGTISARRTGSSPGSRPGAKTSLSYSGAGLPGGGGRTACSRSWTTSSLQISGCFFPVGSHGKAGTWVTFSPLPTPTPAQQAEPAPYSTPFLDREAADAEAMEEVTAELEGCLSSEAEATPAALPTEALGAEEACVESRDLTEAPAARLKEPSAEPEPALVPFREEKALNNTSGVVSEPLVESSLPPLTEFVFPRTLFPFLVFAFFFTFYFYFLQ